MKSIIFVSKIFQFGKANIFKPFTRAKTEHNTVLNEHTLTGRIMAYLVNQNFPPPIASKDTNVHIKANAKKSDIMKNLGKLNPNDLGSVFTMIPNKNSTEVKWEYRNIFRQLDNECCKRLAAHELAIPDILNLLNLYMKIVPNHITEYKFYIEALVEVHANINFLTKNELLQFVFYIGLQKKKNQKNSRTMFKSAFNKILAEHNSTKLNIEETCILCNTAFKLATKIANVHFLEHVIDTINNNLALLKDPALFITLIKTLRHSRHQNEDVLTTISCTILFNRTIKHYSFMAICHILALYADHLYYDDALMKQLFDNGLQQLNAIGIVRDARTHPTNQIRARDLKRFLWSMCILSCEIDSERMNDIVKNIRDRIDNGEYNGENVAELIDTLLYLWMMDCQVPDLITYAVNEDNYLLVKGLASRTKFRVNILLNLIQMENPKLFKELKLKTKPGVPTHDTEYQVRIRPDLSRVFRQLVLLEKRHDMKFKYSYEIPNMNLLGITGYRKNAYKSIFVEVLDGFVNIRNKPSAVYGLMKAKLRVLGKMEEAIITIASDELNEMTDEELRNYLCDELNLLI